MLYKEINSHVVINQLFFYYELCLSYCELYFLQIFSVLAGFCKKVSVEIIRVSKSLFLQAKMSLVIGEG